MLPRSLVRRRRKPRIAAPAAPALRDDHPLVSPREVVYQLARKLVVHNRPHRDLQHHVHALAPGAIRSLAVPAALRLVLRIEPKVHQRIVPLARLHDDVAAAPAVSARRPAPRHELLPPKGHAAVAAGPRLHPNFRLINKHAILGSWVPHPCPRSLRTGWHRITHPGAPPLSPSLGDRVGS